MVLTENWTRHGPPSAQCSATAKSTGERCCRLAVRGSNVCVVHGAAAPQVKAKAAKRVAAAKAERQLAKFVGDLEPDEADSDVDPLKILVTRLAREARMAGAADLLIDELATTHGTIDAGGNPVPGLYGPDHLGDLRPHPLVAIGDRWSDAAARHAKLALDAGVAERRLELDVEMGQLVARAIAAAFDAVGLSLEQRAAARPALEAVLRGAAIDATASPAPTEAPRDDPEP